MDLDMGDIIERFVDSKISEVHTSLPGKILSYDPVRNVADIQILVKSEHNDPDTDDRLFTERPTIPNVPVIFPRGGGYILTLPLGPGDFVWLMFPSQGTSEVRVSGQVSEPIDASKHSLSHAVAVPGAFPDTSPMAPNPTRATSLVLGKDAGPTQIQIGSVDIKLGVGATAPVALAPNVAAALANLVTTVNAIIPIAAPAVPPALPPGPIAATLVKAI